MKHFALIGNPNAGKTTLYNVLTGSTAHVGNWPGVTVEKRVGLYKNKKTSDTISIVDLPGIYSLSPYTPEEVISRNYILDDEPDCVINIVDATNLERNLYLTTQVLEMNVPVIVALNMIDEVEANGEKIDVKELEKRIGVPVVAISALKKTNIDTLMERAIEVSNSKREGESVLLSSKLKNIINEASSLLKDEGVTNSLYHAIKIIENDSIECEKFPKVYGFVKEKKESINDEILGNDLEAMVADERYKYITSYFSPTKTEVITKDDKMNTRSYKIDKVLTNKWVGIPIFLLILFLIFHFTFSANLFFLGGLFKNVAPSFEGTPFEGLIWTSDGINSLGVILQNLVIMLTDYLSSIISSWLSSSPAWVSGLVVDGICAGVFAVLSFVPQILLLFLFFSILEDTGYMARVAFILDLIFRKFGLSGRAFIPMIMGFGCSVPAMINTRTLATENERTATIRVIPFFSCGAKLPILIAIAGGICQMFGFPNPDIITYLMYLVGIITAIICVLLMRHTTMRGKTPPFIMELPTYHLPSVKSLIIHLWDKLKHYVEKAFTIILASTIVIWFLQSFTFDWQFIEQQDPNEIADNIYIKVISNPTFVEEIAAINPNDVENGEVIVELPDLLSEYDDLNDANDPNAKKLYDALITYVFTPAYDEYMSIVKADGYLSTNDSILAGLGKLMKPIFTPLGFGSQLNENGWVFGVSAVTGLIAKENVIATFTVLSQSVSTETLADAAGYIELYRVALDENGVLAASSVISSTGFELKTGWLGWSILIAFIVFNMTTIPCFAAVATARGELSKKKFTNTLIFWLLASYFSASIVYCICSAIWTLPIFILVGVIVCFSIYFINKRKDMKKV